MPSLSKSNSAELEQNDYNLSSEFCVICRDKECEYRCIPCHHVCFCRECVSEFAEKIEDDADLQTQEEGEDFFTQKTEIFSFDKLLVNNSCPICRLQVHKLEYYKPMKKYVKERISKDQYHVDGMLRASNEIFKLGLHLRERPEFVDKISHCRGNFE